MTNEPVSTELWGSRVCRHVSYKEKTPTPPTNIYRWSLLSHPSPDELLLKIWKGHLHQSVVICYGKVENLYFLTIKEMERMRGWKTERELIWTSVYAFRVNCDFSSALTLAPYDSHCSRCKTPYTDSCVCTFACVSVAACVLNTTGMTNPIYSKRTTEWLHFHTATCTARDSMKPEGKRHADAHITHRSCWGLCTDKDRRN